MRVKAEPSEAAETRNTPAQADKRKRRKTSAAAAAAPRVTAKREEAKPSAPEQATAKRRRVTRPAEAKLAAPAAARIKTEPSAVAEAPDTPAQADKGKRPVVALRTAGNPEEAGPSTPEQDACAGPSASTPAAATTTPAPGQAPHSNIEEVVDLSADSPRASSSNQLPGPFAGLPLAPVASDEGVPGASLLASSALCFHGMSFTGILEQSAKFLDWNLYVHLGI